MRFLTQYNLRSKANWSLRSAGAPTKICFITGSTERAVTPIVELSTAIDNSSITLMGWFKSTSNGEPNIYYEGIFGFRNYPQSDGNYFANMN